MPPVIIAAAIGGIGSLVSSSISSKGAQKAAATQAASADRAATLQTQLGQEGVNLQTEQLNAGEQNAWPFLLGGYSAEANLENLMGLDVNGNFSMTPPQFSTPGIPGVAPGTGGMTPPGTVPLAHLSGNPVFPGSVKGTMLPGGPDGLPPGAHGVAGGGPPGTATNVPGGKVPLSSLVNPGLGAKGSLLQGFPDKFTAPTLAEAEQYPGYKFQLDEGVKALQNTAAARGNLLTGQTQADVENYAQGLAQTDYSNVWNQKMAEFNNAYNIFANNQANTYNRLSALAGGGQVQANQLNNTALLGTNSIAGLLSRTGEQVGNDIQNAGAARASGYAASANSWANGVSNLSSLAMLPFMTKQSQNQYGDVNADGTDWG
jgi:hypothetical protein